MNLNYSKNIDKIKFRRHILLIDDEKLKQNIIEKIESRRKIFIEKIEGIVEQGILNKEIKNDAKEGALILYIIIIQGIMDFVLIYELNLTHMDYYANIAWTSFWNGIKRD